MEIMRQQFKNILKGMSVHQLRNQAAKMLYRNCNSYDKNTIIQMIFSQVNQQVFEKRYKYYKFIQENAYLQGNRQLNLKQSDKNRIKSTTQKKELKRFKFASSHTQQQMFQKFLQWQTGLFYSFENYDRIYSKDSQDSQDNIIILNSIETPQFQQATAQYQLKNEQIKYSLKLKRLSQLKRQLNNFIRQNSKRFDLIFLRKNVQKLNKKQLEMLAHTIYSINKELDFEAKDDFEQFILKIQKAVISQNEQQVNIIKMDPKKFKAANIKKRYKYYEQMIDFVQCKTLTIIIDKIKQAFSDQDIQHLAEKLFFTQLMTSSKQIFRDQKQRQAQVQMLNQIVISSIVKLQNCKPINSREVLNYLRTIYLMRLVQQSVLPYSNRINQQLSKHIPEFRVKMNHSIQYFAADLQTENLKQFHHMIYYFFDEDQFTQQAKIVLKQLSSFIKQNNI